MFHPSYDGCGGHGVHGHPQRDFRGRGRWVNRGRHNGGHGGHYDNTETEGFGGRGGAQGGYELAVRQQQGDAREMAAQNNKMKGIISDGSKKGATNGSDIYVDVTCHAGTSKVVGNKKTYCYRCLTKGHINTECTTQIRCDICVSNTHVTRACPKNEISDASKRGIVWICC